MKIIVSISDIVSELITEDNPAVSIIIESPSATIVI